MPDITMCTGEGCPFRAGCYRHTAMPSKYLQSYFVAPPFTRVDPSVEAVTCEHLSPVHEKK